MESPPRSADAHDTAAAPVAGSTPDAGDSVTALASLMRGRRALVLSGVGISTDSGIPDYRGPQGTLRNNQSMQYREFVGSAEARQRY